jgi:hypothetical protein
MKDVLYGLFHDLRQRCRLLRALLEQRACHADVEDYRAEIIEMIALVEEEVERVMSDPAFGAASIIANNLQDYRLSSHMIKLLEWYPVPAILHYGPSDHYFRILMSQALVEMAYPFSLPVISMSKDDYYSSYALFSLIMGPLLEEYSLLGLPDLFHELGHLILDRERLRFLGRFDSELKKYFARERRGVRIAQKPPTYEEIIKEIQQQWIDTWSVEFVCDMIATYLVGAAYGWAHLRLCASSPSDNVYEPGPENLNSTHPSDHARLQGIVEMLLLLNEKEETAHLRSRWNEYLSLTGDNPPQDYALCYPNQMLKKLAQYVYDGCKALGLKPLSEQVPLSGGQTVSHSLNEAWREFLANPQQYPIWEEARLVEMRVNLERLSTEGLAAHRLRLSLSSDTDS